MEKIINIKNELETKLLGKKIGKNLVKGDVIILDGDLSAGKTTLTKGIGEGLGVKRVINSPTFTIVKEYSGTNLKLYHMDLYRLDGIGNDYDLYEYFESDGVCVIEWPYKANELIPSEYLKIEIKIVNKDERIITLIPVGKRYETLVGMIE